MTPIADSELRYRAGGGDGGGAAGAPAGAAHQAAVLPGPPSRWRAARGPRRAATRAGAAAASRPAPAAQGMICTACASNSRQWPARRLIHCLRCKPTAVSWGTKRCACHGRCLRLLQGATLRVCSVGDVLRPGTDRKQQAPLLLVRGSLRLQPEGAAGAGKGAVVLKCSGNLQKLRWVWPAGLVLRDVGSSGSAVECDSALCRSLTTSDAISLCSG